MARKQKQIECETPTGTRVTIGELQFATEFSGQSGTVISAVRSIGWTVTVRLDTPVVGERTGTLHKTVTVSGYEVSKI
jgi:hypothetical protein